VSSSAVPRGSGRFAGADATGKLQEATAMDLAMALGLNPAAAELLQFGLALSGLAFLLLALPRVSPAATALSRALFRRPPRFRFDFEEFERRPRAAAIVGANPGTEATASMRRSVAAVRFETAPLTQRADYPLFVILERAVAELGRGFRVMTDLDLAAYVRPAGEGRDRERALRAIRGRPLDLAVLDGTGRLILAVEMPRPILAGRVRAVPDTVKREVLRSAGVAVLDVPPHYNALGIAARVRTLLLRPAVANAA
jgi:hypothetical protein